MQRSLVGSEMCISASALVELRPTAEASPDSLVVEVWVRDQNRGTIEFNANSSVRSVGPRWVVREPGASHDLPLHEFLVHQPATIFFADGSRAVGDRVNSPPPVVVPVADEIRRPRAWEGTDITVEFGEPPDDRLSVGATVANILTAEMPIVLQDHLPGELADFIGIDNSGSTTEVRLVHCKRSGGLAPAARVGDVEELASQAIRSAMWLAAGPALWEELRHRLEHRDATKVVNGELQQVQELLDEWAQQPPSARWSMWIVQPGVSNAALNDAHRLTALLNAAHAWVQSQNIELELVCSA
jgi:hypothetical protein